MEYIEAGDKVQIVRGKYAGRTGIVTHFNHGGRNGISYKHITVKLDDSDSEVRLTTESVLKKVESDAVL